MCGCAPASIGFGKRAGSTSAEGGYLVKLGLSQASYRWMCYPHLRYDTPEFRYSERRLPYFNSVDPPEDLYNFIPWLVERVAAHDLRSLYLVAGWLKDDDGARAFGAEMRNRGLKYLAAVSVNLAATEDEWGDGRYDRAARANNDLRYRISIANSGWIGGTPFERAARSIEFAALAGAKIIVVVHQEATLHNHFTKDPPIGEQLDRIVRNMRTLVPVAEEHGVVMAHEAHMDYRVSELIDVLEALGSPWLRHNFDFANSISVIEDPLDAARRAAKYTVMTHIKDMRIEPNPTIGEPIFYHTPIGLGDVPVREILGVLQAEAPDPDGLQNCLEIPTMPEYDAEAWVVESLRWLRSECAEFWT